MPSASASSRSRKYILVLRERVSSDCESHEMTTDQSSSNQNHDQEEYIDIDIGKFTTLFPLARSPPRNIEFEFQMCTTSRDKEYTKFPADELFYKGKLLPLHFPRRLEMVQKLFRNSNSTFENKLAEPSESCEVPYIDSFTIPAKDAKAAVDPSNKSPSASCRFNRDLNPDNCFFEWTRESNSFIYGNPQRNWTNNFELVKKSSLGQKLKASRAYVKSLFFKSACSVKYSAKATCNCGTKILPTTHMSLRNLMKLEDENTSSCQFDNDKISTKAIVMEGAERNVFKDAANIIPHRRSFSGVIRRHSASNSSLSSSSSSGASSSSSSFSINSSRSCDLQLFKRSGSSDSETETSITEAIAHCKQSQQLLSSRKTFESTHFSLSSQRVSSFGDQERAGLRKIQW